MNDQILNSPVFNNIEKSRFELTFEGYTAFIDYKKRENIISLIHTESPPELAGKGVAKALIIKTLHYLEEHGNILVPLCPLVFGYIKKNPEWARIVREDYKNKFPII